MIGEVCFTCRRHGAAAEATHDASVPALRVWCVEPKDAGMSTPPGVTLWVREFPRQGNLNGWACAAGMLSVFEELARLGADTIIKRDSDTRVLSARGMAPADGFMARMVRKTRVAPWRGFGACYALTPDALPLLRRAISAHDYPHDSKIPEDDFVSWALRENVDMLPHSRAAFFRNHLRSGEIDPLWINHGNRWESDAWYESAAARA